MNDKNNEDAHLSPDRVAVVTGASTGIGFAIAEFLVQKGMRVLAGYRKSEDADRLKSVGCHPVVLDVTRQSDRKSLFSKLDRLDVLVNNAGIGVVGPVEHVSLEELQLQMEVNFVGPFAMCQLALPMLRRSRGKIINISSISGKVAAPFLGPYAASKFALEALTDSLRREVLDQGIDVVSVNPGPIKTPIWQKGVKHAELQLERIPEKAREVYEKPINFMLNLVSEMEKKAAPVADVVDCVDHALFSGRPKTRYYPGKGNRTQALMLRLAPDRVIDKLALSRFK